MKMRVISGKYKGLTLKGFDINGTRPTMDRVKESLFGMINPYLENAIVLDLFAGSGSLGIEALSNGAKKAYFVDNNHIPIKIIKENLQKIEEEYEILNMHFLKALEVLQNNKFDIIFLDPPYNDNLITKALTKILEYNLLKENGLVICEYEKEEIITDLELIKFKKYGLKNIKIYKNNS